ncbi:MULTISPECIES: V-type ATPase subunit [Lactobacillales]|uniref:V-type ATPase subunit n=1 Tax=Lactobacillales TaxID=186826 RepID=UPI000660B356|nr:MULTISPECIES: V-type ATPase subunit [unclassified Carnobacterium]KAF3301166.1 V-type ATP synthase subunit C [Carnobacterium sp. PL17RED31]KAF3303395.1 V-type ATP synthase subunit C [Carnobacterium sp. PL26RED25]KAF3305557.1 V-type ATP synthase subunit C [Carnobacterium sp. PL17GRE32]KAF3307014.1 V-type ATP synthase subunit C [Carnobacterium sp. PL24RED07]
MPNATYAQLDTTIRVKESSLLAKEDYDALLRANSLEDVFAALRKTNYHIPENIGETHDFEGFLIRDLREMYAGLYEETPVDEVVDVFALRYSYHNLKVLFKEWYTERDFSHMYINIGRFSIEALRTLMQTGEGNQFPEVMKEGVQHARDYYEEYHDLDGISILLDHSYLGHLRDIADKSDDQDMAKTLLMMIDLENLSMVVRGMKQGRSRGFLEAVLSDDGTFEEVELVDLATSKDYNRVLDKFASLPFAGKINDRISANDPIDVVKLDKKIKTIEAEEIRQAAWVPFGPMPVLAYIYFKENEVANLRLILNAKEYDLDQKSVEERMRPIYGL